MKARIRFRLILAAVFLAALAGLLLLVFRHAGADRTEESREAIRNAILKQAMQCYVIEGIFPEHLSYLEEHYGLLINHRDYYVVYTPVAENYPPQVVVTPKGKER